jgi:Immunity protein 32
MLLTVEHKLGENRRLSEAEIEIYCDRDGLDLLLRKLTILKEKGGHVHLMSPAWSGHELTEQKQGEQNILINHLCIMLATNQP